MIEMFVLDDEVARLEAALSPLCDAGSLATLVSLAWHLRQRDTGRALELAAQAESLLPQVALPHAERQRTAARLLLVRGESRWLFADPDVAETLASKALQTFATLADDAGCADAHWLLGVIAADRGNLSRGIAHLEIAAHACSVTERLRAAAAEAAAAHFTALLDRRMAEERWASGMDGLDTPACHPGLAALANSFRTSLAFGAGDFGNAIAYGMLAYDTAFATGQIKRAIIAATHIGAAFSNLNDLDTALEWMRRGLELARHAKWPMSIGSCLTGMGNTLRLLGQLEAAQELLDEALETLKGFPKSRVYTAALLYLGNLALDRGDHAKALHLFLQLDEQASAADQADALAMGRCGQAHALLHLDRPHDALAAVSAALVLARRESDAIPQMVALQILADIHAHYPVPAPEGMTAATAPLHYLQQALDLAGTINGFTVPSDLLDAIASEYAKLGDHAKAYTYSLQASAARARNQGGDTGSRPMIQGVLHQAEHGGTLREQPLQTAAPPAKPSTGQGELTRFLAAASHDLRQPMHALSLYLGALLNVDMPEAARPLLANVHQCAQIMDGMFLSLLDLSRLDAQVVKPVIEPFAAASLLARIAGEFGPQAKSRGLDLRTAPCKAWVESDLGLVEQILRNLTSNAVRYTESGKILIGCRRKGKRLRIAVHDTGAGMTEHQQKLVLESLGHAVNVGPDRTKGLGLGLAIVQRLARLLAVPVSLSSVPGQGSVFAIDLPLFDAPPRLTIPEPVAMASPDLLAAKFVVVVDDEEAIRDAMRVLLEQWGCTVVTAASGHEALSKLGSCTRKPDALLCDYRLHYNENGLDVIRALQSEFNDEIPALLITAETAGTTFELPARGVSVLRKPVQADTLRSALIQLLSTESPAAT